VRYCAGGSNGKGRGDLEGWLPDMVESRSGEMGAGDLPLRIIEKRRRCSESA